MSSERIVYPFAAIVGQTELKLALLLNAINPQIGGLLIRGPKGTGKSTSVRALADLLPEIAVVEGCKFNCSPVDPTNMCFDCLSSYQQDGGKISQRLLLKKRNNGREISKQMIITFIRYKLRCLPSQTLVVRCDPLRSIG